MNDINHLDRMGAGYEVHTTIRVAGRSNVGVGLMSARRLLALTAAPDGARPHGSTSRSQILLADEPEAHAYSETQSHRRPNNEHN